MLLHSHEKGTVAGSWRTWRQRKLGKQCAYNFFFPFLPLLPFPTLDPCSSFLWEALQLEKDLEMSRPFHNLQKREWVWLFLLNGVLPLLSLHLLLPFVFTLASFTSLAHDISTCFSLGSLISVFSFFLSIYASDRMKHRGAKHSTEES